MTDPDSEKAAPAHRPAPSSLPDALLAGTDAGHYRYRGYAAGPPGDIGYTVDVLLASGTLTRRWPDEEMAAWLTGFERGRRSRRRSSAGQRAELDVREVLVDPAGPDRRRLRILTAMEHHGWTYARLAREMHSDRKTIARLLSLRAAPLRQTVQTRTLGQAEAALGELLDTVPDRPPAAAAITDAPIPSLAAAAPEPAGIRRARALALAYEAGLIGSWSPYRDPQTIRLARDFVIDTHPVHASLVVPYLQGLADGTALARRGGADRIEQLALDLT